MKKELLSYISGQRSQLKEIENSNDIFIDFDRIDLLLEEWMVKYNRFTINELEIFFDNIRQIINAELEMRRTDSNCKGIWLTK